MFWINQKPWSFERLCNQGAAKSFFSSDLCVGFGGELWESKPTEANSGTLCIKENITIISLIYTLNQASADMVWDMNAFD